MLECMRSWDCLCLTKIYLKQKQHKKHHTPHTHTHVHKKTTTNRQDKECSKETRNKTLIWNTVLFLCMEMIYGLSAFIFFLLNSSKEWDHFFGRNGQNMFSLFEFSLDNYRVFSGIYLIPWSRLFMCIPVVWQNKLYPQHLKALILQ